MFETEIKVLNRISQRQIFLQGDDHFAFSRTSNLEKKFKSPRSFAKFGTDPKEYSLDDMTSKSKVFIDLTLVFMLKKNR